MTRRAWRIALSTIAMGPLLMWLVACSTTVSTSSGPVSNEAPSARPGGSEEGDPDRRAAVRLELASAYFSRGQFDVALGEVKLALAANPNLGAAYNLRGLIYGNLGENALAEESFRRALQINASDTDAMQNYGWYLCGQRRYAEAQAQFSQALSVPRNRQVPRTLLTQGVCQARAGLLPEAETSLQRSLDLDPGNPSTVMNLAEVLYRRSDYERARFYIRRVNSQPSLMNAQTLWLAARIEKQLGNQSGVQDLGNQLLNRFRESREARAYEKGQFNE